jgi:vacuolar-type H+-ATPase subunit E/Vma4
MSQAYAEAQETLEEAKSEAESLRQEAETAAKSERAALLQEARAKAETLREEAMAEAQIRAQQVKLSQRQELLDRVFATARRRLHSASDWPDYAQIVRHLAQESVERLGAEEALIRLDERTHQALGDQLSELLSSLEQETGVNLTLGEALPERTGVAGQTPDGHRRYDNTLETRLARMEENLRAPVYRILTKGES